MNDETHDAMAGPYQDERNDRRTSIGGELRPMNLMQDKLILVHAALPFNRLGRLRQYAPRG
jgi:hypothetical protein